MARRLRMAVSRRQVLGTLSAAWSAGALAGCAGPGSSGGTVAEPTKAAKVARVVVRAGSSQPLVDLFDQKLLPAYRQRVPQHTVEMEWLPGAGAAALVETLTTAKASGTDPDAFF